MSYKLNPSIDEVRFAYSLLRNLRISPLDVYGYATMLDVKETTRGMVSELTADDVAEQIVDSMRQHEFDPRQDVERVACRYARQEKY